MEKDELRASQYFQSNIYSLNKPEWVSDIDKACDIHIERAKGSKETYLKNRREVWGEELWNKKGDFGVVYHSDSRLLKDPKLDFFVEYCGTTACQILDSQGFDLTNRTPFFTSMWVQEFPKSGGGFHKTHVHENDHISGFYYLKCSERTSVPVFHDPRPAALQSYLPEKKSNEITFASRSVHYNPVPGTLIFFNSYMPHEYRLDAGLDDFRFIHFNIQFVKNDIVDYCKSL